uniref:Amino acid adenylation domain-containing protein n=1 Tax=Verrucosispora sp. MS100047 TaxID=1410949 RepID=A0A097CSS9_9ACTN|nr:amino acid adenylation domain-containing protein [Verrucosispora sp. MS100047]
MDARSSAPRPAATLRAGLGPILPVPAESSVIDLFEATVARTPDRPAVRFRDQTLTFRKLNQHAEALAESLVERGVGVGDFVPLVIAEGVEFPIGLLAAMKVGAPFVPVDPGWPASRLAELFRQLSPRVVLAVAATAPALVGLGTADHVLIIDRTQLVSGTPTGPRPGPDDLIYGYFTSGSTGTPKCALNRHRGLVNRLAAMSHHFGDGAEQIVLQNSKPTFDSSMWQLLWPLTTGGQVVLPDRQGILDLEQTCHILGRYAVTITDFVPSVLGALVSLLELRADLCAELAGLRRMLIGGEEANGAVLDRLWKLLPDLRVTNTFGPTECSIGSVFHEITEVTGRIPLGTAIGNTAAVVLDDARRPVPPETVGEIYIGGLCVGAGYLGDPERTARAFVPNPFPEIAGDLLYRTGDLGHHTPDGLLMFDGRRDDQVKVGGVRIELAEVERVLAAHPAVRGAAVIVRGEGDARSLAAFVSLRSDESHTVTPATLVDWLRASLPPETVPRAVTVVDEIPLTPHGKLDRRALEQVARTAAGSAPVEAPGSPAEELVASAWCEVLGRAEVSVSVPFADYGGTSLLTHQLAALLGLRQAGPVSLAHLLAADTVRAQARLLGSGQSDTGAAVDLGLLARDADPSDLVGAGVPPAPTVARQLLLTGVTGFVGAHVLAELVTRPEVELHCLVRAADPAAGAARLVAVLRAYGLTDALTALEHALVQGRVRVVTGDLGAPLLGLDDTAFRALAGAVDAVVHAGALVNFLRDYGAHRRPNVFGTGELVRLAAAGSGCRLHVLSTFSVLSAAARGTSGTPIGPDRLPGLDEPLPPGGYDQSKLVAEHLLERARGFGVDAVVYRLGEIWPHRRIGLPNRASLAHSVVYAAARTGVVFPTGARTDHLPVDLLAGCLADAVLGAAPAAGGTVHLLRPGGLGYAEIFARLAEAGAEHLGYAEFRSRLSALAASGDADERLVRVAMLLPAPQGADPVAPASFDRLFTDSSAHFTSCELAGQAFAAGSPLADLAAFLDRLDVAR